MPFDDVALNDADHADLPQARQQTRSLIQRLRRRDANNQPIGVVLLNQRLLGGVSNVAKSEALFHLRVSPFRKVGALRDSLLGQILRDCQARRLAHGPGSGAAGVPLWVYGRSGEPCRVCATEVRMRRQGLEARSTYFCPRCQDVG